MHYDRASLLPVVASLLVVCGLLGPVYAESPVPSKEGVEFFETHIRPVLVDKCYQCHSAKAKKLKGGLRLDTAQRMRAGGESGPVIVPNKPDESPLISALRYESEQMPPSGKLAEPVINDFVKWVSMGAPDPRTQEDAAETKNEPKPYPLDRWIYKRPQRPAPPTVNHMAAVRSDIDRFVVARLESAGLTPSPQAEPRALFRRLYYDLIGLPPTAQELDEFAADPSDARYAATVDRLLASPQFGERWGRYWLDIARYADTKGYVFQEDRSYKEAYTYRDWVIASFNSDRPYNKFIVAQIAADQIGDPSCAPAIGFLTLGRRFLNSQPDIINDRIDVVSRGLLGLTVGCARCHDHKYDPIKSADYYAMYGVFASSQEEARKDCPPMLVDSAKPYDPVVFLRGNPANPGPKVDRRFLDCLSPNGKAAPFQQGSGRLEMARDIASRDNPLTARVWVNRIWEHLFGHGIVDTPSDFGVRGTPPTHPLLLDWLASDLMDHHWSTKRMIRQIVLSATYRQSSAMRAECTAVDPENRLLWRANRRRLDLEALRDSLLVAAGRLDTKMGGPSVSITTAPFSTRRAVYGYIERQNLPAFFRTFDFANPNTHTPVRPQTTSPQQALFLMNSQFVIEQASYLAARSNPQLGGGDSSSPDHDAAANRVRRITRLFRCALGRDPTIDEVTDALDFVDGRHSDASAALTDQLAWQFGWGTYDEPAHAMRFQQLPHFANNAWQAGAALPDHALGWVRLTAEGGHPGDAQHAAIRRWTAPSAGTVHIEGVLAHPANRGDGVRGRIVASRVGIVGAWQVAHSQAGTSPAPFAVQKGDTIDFITDSRGGVDSDTFNWPVTLRLTAAGTNSDHVWESTSGFHGPLTPPLTRWQELAQVLMMSNEFAFID
ncbi:MAG TPA: PSD1 and planctomycete cytochrome C domain-containing protein [Lacipirellulaceae bacterium]|nr:PSD1 and planctomycete cytochrome C domain-containing protein [Lacipirellulaceae bacterium]